MKIIISENQGFLLLVEAKIDDLFSKYCEKIQSVGYPCDTITKTIINNLDPTPTKKYLEWIIKNIVLGDDDVNVLYANVSEEILDYLRRFYGLSEKNQIENKDINLYKNFDELVTAVLEAEDRTSKKSLVGQYDKLYEDEEYVMVRPLTTEASCKFGVDTKWCIAARMDNAFSRYTEKGQNEFFFVIKKGAGRGIHNRLAVQMSNYGKITVWNSEDRIEDPKILNTLPNGITKIIDDRVKELKSNDVECYAEFENIGFLGFGKFFGRFKQITFDMNKDNFATYRQIKDDYKDGFYIINLNKSYDVNDGQKKVMFSLSFYYDEKKYKIISFSRYCTKNPIDSAMEFIAFVNERSLVFQKHTDRIKGKFQKRGGFVYWYPSNSTSTYTFENPEKSGQTTKAFIAYIKEQNSKGKPATQKGFVESLGKEYRSGYLSMFFGSIKDSGIVKRNKNGEYVLGPNYDVFMQGKLRRDFKK